MLRARIKSVIFLEFLQFGIDVVGARVGAIWSVPQPNVYRGPH